MFRRHSDIGHAHDRIGPRREHPQLVVLTVERIRERETHAHALADPVLLHQAHLFRPACQRIQIGQQFVGVFSDRHVVHGDLALFDQCARAPAAPVNHLFVGQYRLIDRVPVHGPQLLVNQALFKQACEQPLFPAVVLGGTGGQLARPVEGEAQTLQLRAHGVDVFVGPLGRWHIILQRGVFGRHTEGIPAHGLQHVVALHAVITRQHITDGVIAHVPHVQLATGVGEHRKAVILGFVRVLDSEIGTGIVPVCLRRRFNVGGQIFFLHGVLSYWMLQNA